MTLLLVEARMTSRFSLPRSDSATFSVPPVLTAALAGALACDVPWVGLVAAVDAGVGPAPRQAATRLECSDESPAYSPFARRMRHVRTIPYCAATGGRVLAFPESARRVNLR